MCWCQKNCRGSLLVGKEYDFQKQKRIIGDEHLYLIGLKTNKNKMLEIFRPKNVLREEDISKLEKLN